MNPNSHRLPIFRDDRSFQDRREDPFRGMQRQMEEDLQRAGFGQDWGTTRLRGWQQEPFEQDFFELKPRPRRLGELKRDEFGSRESLDDNTVDNLLIENPQTKSRQFRISFDVKDYDPMDISVKIKDDTLMVEARHEGSTLEGSKNVREFNRKIKVPVDVDPNKLESTLSNDGILTISAPVPPKYQSVVYIQPSQNGEDRGQTQRAIPQRQSSSPSSPQYSAYPPAPQYGQKDHPLQQQYSQPQQASPYSPQPGHQQQYYSQSPPPLTNQQQQQQQQMRQQGYRDSQSPLSSAATSPPPAVAPQSPRSPQLRFVQPVSSSLPMDTPVYRDTETGRKMDLMLEIAKPFTPDDLIVKLEGSTLFIEAEHVEKAEGKSSKSSMCRDFDLKEPIVPNSVQAMLRSDGKLIVTADVQT